MADSLIPGIIVAERFRLDRLLGEGGMGAVWAATHVVTQKRVALKVLKGADTELAVRRFLREARAASAVRHTHIVQVHDVLTPEGGVPVMVMDLCVGESLSTRLTREKRLPLPELAEILVPILSALGTAHAAGIVHRDLKPDNLFLDTAEDGRVVPKVLDFGIAKLSAIEGQAAATAALTETGAFMGTPYYMSPEQIFGEKDIDHRSDVWAVGVILYECLSGRRPFDGANFGQIMKGISTGDFPRLEQLVPELPQPVSELVSRMLRVDRKQRPADLREPYELLRQYANTHALSFGGARAVLDVDSGSDTLDPASKSVRELGVAETRLAEPNRGGRLRFLYPALGVGAAALVLGGVVVLRQPPGERSGAAGSASASTSAGTLVGSLSAQASADSATPALAASSPEALPSASTSAQQPTPPPSASAKPPLNGKHGHGQPGASASASTGAGPLPTPSTTAVSPVLPGGVVGHVPF